MRKVISVVLVICVLVGSVILDTRGYCVFGAEVEEMSVLEEMEETLDVMDRTESLGEADVVDTEMQEDEDVSVPIEREKDVEAEMIVPQEEEVRASEEDLRSGDFTYKVLNDGKVEITGYTGNAGEVEIPGIIDGKSVIGIGKAAFNDCYRLRSIKIPEGITSIGDSAFYDCIYLNSVKIPEGVTSIGNFAFYGCSSLSSIEIPQGVTSIGNDAFSCCSSLSSIKIPEGVTNIGYEAFSRCSSLTSVGIPASVTNIGGGVFAQCEKLKKIEVSSKNMAYDSRNNCNAIIEKATNTLVAGCETTVIPDNIMHIGYEVFQGCSNLSSIEIPKGLISIGNYAFQGCSNLSSIEIPEGVTSIGNDAFSGCSSLSSIKIPEGVTSIEHNVFSGCSSLESIEISKRVTSIESFAFYGCSSLSSIEIPEGLRWIGNSTFCGCRSLGSIKIPEGVTYIFPSAFKNCSSLKSIEISERVTSISNDAFYGCSSLSNIEIPEGVKYIGYRAFSGCSSLSSMKIPEGVTSIDDGVFYGCSSLESIEIPKRVTNIGDYAFSRCEKLKDVYYGGSKKDWVSIDIYPNNECLTNAIIHYNSTGEDIGAASPLHLTQQTPAILGKEFKIDGHILRDSETEEDIANPITWTSSDSSIIDISNTTSIWENGMLSFTATPQKAGTVTLTATTSGGITDKLEIKAEPELIKEKGDFYLAQESSLTLCSASLDYADKEYLEAFMTSLTVKNMSDTGNIWHMKNLHLDAQNGRLAYFIAVLRPIYNGSDKFQVISPGGQTLEFIITSGVDNYRWSGMQPVTKEDIALEKAKNEFITAFDEFIDKSQKEIKKMAKKNATSVENLANVLKKEYGAQIVDVDLPKEYEDYIYMALSDALAEVANAKMSDISYTTDAVKLGTDLTKAVINDFKRVNKSITSEDGKATLDINISSIYGVYTGQITCTELKKPYRSYTVGVTMTQAHIKGAMEQYAKDLSKLGKDAVNSVYYALAEDITGKSVTDFTSDFVKKKMIKYQKKLEEIGMGKFVDICSSGYEIYSIASKISGSKNTAQLLSQMQAAKSLLESDGNALANGTAKKAAKKVMKAADNLLSMWTDYITNGTVSTKEGFAGFVKNIFNCPVTISVYDSKGTQIGYVGEDDIWYNDSILIEEAGDAKIVYVPFDMQVSFKAHGTDYGVLNCAMEEYDRTGNIIGRLNYYDIPLTPDTEISVALPSENLIGGHSDMALSVNGTLVYASECIPVNQYEESSISVALHTDSEKGGIIYGAGTYIFGNTVNLIALSNPGYMFAGWYDKEGWLVSVKRNLEFAARTDVDYVAQFVAVSDENSGSDHQHTWTKEKITQKSTCTRPGTKLLVCEICGETKTETIPKAPHTPIADKASDPTYVIPGKTEGTHCAVCGAVLTAQQEIPALGIKRYLSDNIRAKIKISFTTAEYTGKPICPEVKVAFDGATLTPDVDYQVSYKNNVNIGTAAVVITGMGKYMGSDQCNFIIKAKKGAIYKKQKCTYKMLKDNEMAFCGITDAKAKKVTIPKTIDIGGQKFLVTAIENGAFKNTNITSVSIGENVKTIGANVFYGCKKLKSITIPSKVVKIGQKAFYNCKNLKKITINTTKLTKNTVGSKAFSKISKKAVVKVPKSKLNTYKKLLRSKGLDKKATVKKK